eukprot:XP_017944848.1 PREDICTED: mitochondrial peptide methionine sulfoxide reductase isoform X2 [Xenopus tropicalis]
MFPLSAPVPSLPSFQHHLGPLGCLSSSVTSAVSPRASLPPVTSAQRSNAFRTVSMAAGCSAISHRLVTAEGEEFKSRDVKELTAHGYGQITTEISEAKNFYYAEDYHQQYLSKIPNGYCGMGGTGVTCPIGVK